MPLQQLEMLIKQQLCRGAVLSKRGHSADRVGERGIGSKRGSVARRPPLCLDEMQQLETLKTSCH